MADTPEAIQKAKKLYLFIGLFLFFFTGITVAVATFEFLDFGGHGFDAWDATIGLIIAAFKSFLVMFIFMHLNHEKPLVYFFFALALVMAFFCISLIGWSKSDPIRYGNETISDGFYDPAKPATKPHRKISP
ncbi:cytochrome C oxidase subunit IV family protein, partial [Akkermansiaceae bacterium]|nr:cytochrome C oxidase subunit IV family protein [Akkermansiaceae bacterium]